ncbi:hypothetical protein GCM10009777_13930 [Microbacterium pumilum]|uniref:DUF4190 domain-containing protein n=1 Tax=Microbacterium pumilum TaxID=344165 RepID=A0ABN2S7A6_9MICO
MDRPPDEPPEQPHPEGSEHEEPPPPAGPEAPEAAAPEQTASPGEPSVPTEPPPAESSPDETPPGEPPVATPSAMAYPPVPPAPPQGQSPFEQQPPEEKDSRPGVGPGVATGCGLQVLAVILFFLTAGIIPSFFGALWPFILFTIGAALLMLSRRWRRFATGALIVAAATWIVVIGPCIAIINGFGV